MLQVHIFQIYFFNSEQYILQRLVLPTGVICAKYLQKCHRIFVYTGSQLIDLICRCKMCYLQ